MSGGNAPETPGNGGGAPGQQPGPPAGAWQHPGSADGYPPPEATQPAYGQPSPYGAAPSPYGAAPSPYGAPPPYGAQPFGPGQPGPGYGAYPGSPPPTHLAWGIVAAIGGVMFCLIGGLPTAIAATTYARRVQRKWAIGDAQGAWQDSRTARNWAIAATVLDVIGILVFLLVIGLGLNAGNGGAGTP